MPKKDLLRDSVEKELRVVFQHLVDAVKDSPSRSVVIRKLTEAFRQEEERIGELCQRMESRLLSEQESYLFAYKVAVEAIANSIIEAVTEPGDIKFFQQRLSSLKEARSKELLEIDRRHSNFIEKWTSELQRETTEIVNKFHDEAVRIMTEGLLVDDATTYLDPHQSIKH